MSPDTGPRWYETPLWFVAWLVAYGVVLTILRIVLPDDLGAAGRTFVSLALVAVTFASSVALRARLRRRDA